MYKVSIVSLGCSKNLVDSEVIMSALENRGYTLVEDESEAEVIIVNTCCFIEDAKMESIEMIIELGELKKEKCKAIIVTGCMAQRYKEQILNEMPEVDAIATIGADLTKAVVSAMEGNKCVIDSDWDISGDRVLTTPSYTAYLKIAEGCDNHCTYCVIPSIRGKYVSRPMEDIISEAKRLASGGVKELVVIAQDTTNYGVDLYGEKKLPELLDKLCELDLTWIRLQYCYPERVTDELIDTIARQDKICNYIDLPIQHTEDRILKLMGRHSTKAQITELVNKLRSKIPDIVIRTTLITGFPSETGEEFDAMCDYINEMEFDRLGAFAYSCEEDTPAAKMPDQLPEETKVSRQETIMMLQYDVANAKAEQLKGKVLDYLIEGYDEVVKKYFGRTYADSPEVDTMVFASGAKGLEPGTMAKVEITDFMDYDLYGELITE
ncbi:MAG: 30S ribosomal protein S12 methylthiotransferase RimO [Eubacteriales bacterium]|nr:30S ribosomal protein S12 methylthiotransferase RimO [Eubacteriales bacterium]